MKKLMIVTLLLSSFVLVSSLGFAQGVKKPVPPATYPDSVYKGPVTPLEIIEMSNAKLSDSIIINKINDSGAEYDLSVADIINLKNVGVSDNVINYMISAKPTPVAKRVVPQTVVTSPQVTYVVPEPTTIYTYDYYTPPVNVGFSFGSWGGCGPSWGWGYRRRGWYGGRRWRGRCW
ncbi:MAG: hypothetical protein P9M13_05215 [Candidatus Ancaeobacter aquaticus]|nr:hypothetical protein [Candidatus Ancaeobacter aquaticus]